MDTISNLVREDIQQLSGGRIASIVEIDGESIRLITSARRKKTVSAVVRDGMVELSVPALMRDGEIVESARGLITKLKTRQHQSRRFQSNPELFSRALHLARVWLNSEVRPTSVVWSDRQNTMWGSCSTGSGKIRISTMLEGMPQWVVDGVLVHELAHLKHDNHGQEFRDFTAQYPRMAEADAYLQGVSFARGQGQGKTFPDVFD